MLNIKNIAGDLKGFLRGCELRFGWWRVEVVLRWFPRILEAG